MKFIKNTFICFFIFNLIFTMLNITISFADSNPDPQNSNGTVTFTEATGSVDVRNPLYPSEMLFLNDGDDDPDNPNTGITNMTGPLTIDYVTPLNFGTHPVSARDEVYYTTRQKPFIQVTDRRSAKTYKWHVTVKLNQFESNGSLSLQNSSITFYNNAPNCIVFAPNNVIAGYTSPAPQAPLVPSSLELKSGDSSRIFIQAGNNSQGVGTWLLRWFNNNNITSDNSYVRLNVPKNTSSVGSHNSTLTWTMIAGPN